MQFKIGKEYRRKKKNMQVGKADSRHPAVLRGERQKRHEGHEQEHGQVSTATTTAKKGAEGDESRRTLL
jgi:hypothetical protein